MSPLLWRITLEYFYLVSHINILRPRQNGHRFTNIIFKCILLNENVWNLIKISLKIVPKGPINNIPALVQIMAWPQPCDKPWLYEAIMGRLPTHICVTRPQWLKPSSWTKCFWMHDFQLYFWIIILCIFIEIELRLFPVGLIDCKAVLRSLILVQVIVWYHQWRKTWS